MKITGTGEGGETEWHKRDWYKERFGVDPLKLNIPHRTVPNPLFERGAPMRFWRERDIEPYRSVEGVEKFARRRQAGLKAFETRKKRLIELCNGSANIKRLCEIDEEISKLRRDEQRCDYCAELTKRQYNLCEERRMLFMKLVRETGLPMKTIQLARRYFDEESRSKSMKN